MEAKKRIDVSIPLWWPSGTGWKRLARWLLPSPGTIVLILVLLWAQSAGALPLAHQAAPASPSTTTVNYQGRLADAGGMPINGMVTLQFALYATDVDPTPLWGPETHPNVPVSDGLFSVILGSQLGGIPQNILGGDLWLEINIEGETLSPRERLGTVPYAMQAMTVPDRAITSRHVHLSNGRASPSSNMSLTTSYQTIPGMSIELAPTTDQTYLLYLVVEFIDQGGTDGYGVASLYVDGEQAPGGAALMDWDADLGTVAQVYRVDLAAGEHTVEVRAKSNQGGGQIWQWHTSLTWFSVSQ